MKKVFLGFIALAVVFFMISQADARGRTGSHRVGGYNSHGKGSHYVGGHVRSGPAVRHRHHR